MAKTFIAVTAKIFDNRLVNISTSHGHSLTNEDGITFEAALKFFFSLRRLKKDSDVFICYAFQTENEFLFSQLPAELRDKLFRSHKVREQLEDLEYELDELDYQLLTIDDNDENYQLYDFEKYVNQLSLKELVDVEYRGYKIRLINGKLLSVNKSGQRFILFDVYGFFRKPLQKAVNEWCKEDIPLLNIQNLELIGGAEVRQLAAYGGFEARHIAKLMTVLNDSLIANDIHLSRFHGATTISSYLLSKSKARKQYHSYKHRRQFGGRLHHAVTQAYYGGRIEQLKIGTFNDGVNVYDINSAYAHASSLLPVITGKPLFSDKWKNETFSLWYCDYDFSALNPYFGLLPNRDIGNLIKYKVRGKSFFWQPEVKYILDNYPNCINIQFGYYFPYKLADFTKAIIELYELRIRLQHEQHPLEKVIKLALAAIYGKFCQRDGYSYYYNLFYAGFITSFTRAKMLEAVKGYERSIICFLTDAIHTIDTLPILESDALGSWKRSEYERAQYLDSGIYRLYDAQGNVVKEKSKGFRSFDFEKALQDLQAERQYTGLAEFFIGHNLHTFLPMHFQRYLSLQVEPKTTNPFEQRTRYFETLGIDLTETWCDSKIVDTYSRESAPYQNRYHREADTAMDSIMAAKI